ncbi:hypothetical protein D915_000443 [Fasciola hepatica]|uniref:Uncharacterized protein n=1 Tax=Fasciola hepatica TaxID=6192 RepID=A0A2H1CXR6_FASHE|nr:hypothetical protein D915_000443 [Fasciola hepatica]
MGNCLKSSKDTEAQFESLFDSNLQKISSRKLNDSVPDLLADSETGTDFPFKNETNLRHAGDLDTQAITAPITSDAKGTRDSHNVLCSQNTAVSKPPGFSAHAGKQDRINPAWLKYINSKPTGDMDTDNGSVFAENWDPVLFDQRGSPSALKSLRYQKESGKGRNCFHNVQSAIDHRKAHYTGVWNHWNSNESMTDQPLKCNKTPLVSSSILGFSQLRTDVSDSMEWFRNGEIESPQPNAHNFLIKGKQKPTIQSGLNENNADSEKSPGSSGVIRSEKTDYREGWLRYTMFLHQEKTDALNFYATIRKAKHTLLSLEARTGCEIRLSKRLFVHRGKHVRTVVIDGPSRKHILRCYSSLPTLLTKMIILECERPSISEHRTSSKLPDSVTGIRSFPSFLPREVPA